MNKNIIWLFIALTGLSSCKDFLNEDPEGKVSSEVFFTDSSSLPLTVNAVYFKLNGVFNQSAYLSPFMGADDLTSQPGTNKQPFREIDQFAASNSNDRLSNYWNYLYGAIRVSNSIILNLDINTATQEIKNQCAGQAYFVRAYSYYFLVRIFGKIPIITTTDVDYTVSRSSFTDVYNFIVNDLQKAELLLPKVWADGTYQGVRPGSGAAKALLASVYQTMAGYPLNLSGYYALSASKAKEVLDDEATYGYEIIDNFSDLWTWANNYTNKEIVFGCFYKNSIVTYTWENGNMSAPMPGRPDDEGGWSDYYAEISFFKKFPAGVRKDATFQTTITKSDGTMVNWDDATTNHKHPFYKKYQDAENITDWWSSRTMQLIRYADVLLTYAESKAMADGPDDLAYTCVNRIRKRAGLGNLATGLSATAFRDSVVTERGWEFVGGEPTSRWFDLVRLERVESSALDRDVLEVPLVNQPSKSSYFMPIPGTEISLNPNLGDD